MRHRRRRRSGRAYAPPASSRSARTPRATRGDRPPRLATRGRRTSRSSSATARTLTVVSRAGLGRRRRPPVAPRTRWSAATRRSSTSRVTLGGDLVRIVADRRASPARAATPSCSACTSPTPASTSSTGCSSTTPRRNCTSDVLYKNALQGESARARSGSATCCIRPAAEGTDTYEMNRNLLLSDGARADSVPNLEIETGEIVGAGHASATGRFDDQQLFYLQSRGHPGGRGPPPRRPRLLRRRHRPHRRRRTVRAASDHRGRARRHRHLTLHATPELEYTDMSTLEIRDLHVIGQRPTTARRRSSAAST